MVIAEALAICYIIYCSMIVVNFSSFSNLHIFTFKSSMKIYDVKH